MIRVLIFGIDPPDLAPYISKDLDDPTGFSEFPYEAGDNVAEVAGGATLLTLLTLAGVLRIFRHILHRVANSHFAMLLTCSALNSIPRTMPTTVRRVSNASTPRC